MQLRNFGLVLLIALVAGFPGATFARGPSYILGFAKTLGPSDRKAFEEHIAAWTIFQASKDAFWGKVSAVRKKRKARKRAGLPILEANYVKNFPPIYEGPKLSKSLARRWVAYRARREKKKPSKKSKGLPKVEDFLAYARKHYGFRPERVPERTFKKRYAREALRHGLTKEQVVRVYALETSGLGRADMVAGMGRTSKRKRPISTAIGYAQLLVANTIEQLVLHGSGFIARLTRMAKEPGITPERKQRLLGKIASLRKMVRYVKSRRNKWSVQQKMGRTEVGRGVHAINIDGDIGPWLQVIKLKGIKDMAARRGRPNLASHQLELMNLAGPGTGLEMMTSVGLKMPTVNFFSRRGYERNSIVRGNTSRQLLDALTVRMNENVKNKGAIVFNAVFDEVMGERRVAR